MHRQPVQSSALQSIGYDEETHTLELEFHENSGIWQYSHFKPAALKKFLNSESLGNFFVAQIKGKYKEKRVG
nr:KTSC domain-containing protein [uncultured Mucilaginibacter sp.]